MTADSGSGSDPIRFSIMRGARFSTSVESECGTVRASQIYELSLTRSDKE